MQLHFRNQTSATIWVAIMFYSPDTCSMDGQWGTRGWWQLAPGGEAFVLNTDNEHPAYYAESSDGHVWSGPYGPVYVHQTSFESCVNIGDNGPETRVVGMQLVDMEGSDVHYVNLTL
jgi:hypothetical protein